jgi:hypothetical protein
VFVAASVAAGRDKDDAVAVAHPCVPPYENVWEGQAVQLTAPLLDQLLSDCLDIVTMGPYAPAPQVHVYEVAPRAGTGFTAPANDGRGGWESATISEAVSARA